MEEEQQDTKDQSLFEDYGLTSRQKKVISIVAIAGVLFWLWVIFHDSDQPIQQVSQVRIEELNAKRFSTLETGNYLVAEVKDGGAVSPDGLTRKIIFNLQDKDEVAFWVYMESARGAPAFKGDTIIIETDKSFRVITH